MRYDLPIATLVVLAGFLKVKIEKYKEDKKNERINCIKKFFFFIFW